MSTIFGERLPLSGKGLHTQPHIGNDRNRYLWLKNLLQILSPTWYCQFYDTYLPNFMKHLILQLRPRLYTADYQSIPFGWIFGRIYFCYNSLEYSPVLPPTHTACQISRKSWGKSSIYKFPSKTLQNYIFLFVKPTIWGKFNGFTSILSLQTLYPGENSNWFTIRYGICIVPILLILMLFQKLFRMQSLECMECWRFWKTYFF